MLTQPLAYSYVRMSTDIQLKGDSLRRQTERSKKYAEENGLALIEDFKIEDIGVSAFKGDNVTAGALGKFLEAVKSGRVPKGSYLLVESFDRLSRQKLNAAVPLFFDITSSGINLVTLSDNQLYRAGETDFAQLIVSIAMMARANEESEIKSQRVSAAWKAKRDTICEKKLTRLCPAWLELSDDRKCFHVNEKRAAIVRRIFEESAGGQGTFVITRRLNAAGQPPFGRSKGWVQSYVSKILQNRAVLGEFQPHTKRGGKRIAFGDPIPNYFPQIVDEGLFLRAQAARSKRRQEGGGRKGTALRNLFTHIAKCGYCGSPMHFVNKGQGPKGGTYLRCSGAMKGLQCVSTAWRYQDFERSFFLFVKEVDLAAILAASSNTSEVIELDKRLISLVEKSTQLELQRERTYRLITDGSVSLEFLGGKLKACEDEITAVNAQITEAREQLARIRERQTISPEELQGLVDQLQDMDGADSFAQRTVLAARLRELIGELNLEVEGQKPRQSRAVEFLAQADIDPADRQQLLDAIDRSNIDGQRHNRSFTIILTDGSSRRIVLNNDDPTDFVAEVLIDKDGAVSGSDRGTSFEKLFEQIS